jgi:hypothetical protein
MNRIEGLVPARAWGFKSPLRHRRGVNRSELLRQGALAVLEADEIAAADARLQAAYRRQLQEPAFVDAARRLASENAPAW